MYIENAEKFLKKLNFLKINECEYYLKLSDKKQLFAVSTSENDIMFISEHVIIEPREKPFELDDKNYDIISEYVEIGDLAYVLYNHSLISRTYYQLMRALQKLIDNKIEATNEMAKAHIEDYIEWIETAIFYMDEEHENAVWASDEDMIEFIEHCKKDGII